MNPAGSSSSSHYIQTPIVQLEGTDRCPKTGRTTPCCAPGEIKSFPVIKRIGNTAVAGELSMMCDRGDDSQFAHSEIFMYKLSQSLQALATSQDPQPPSAPTRRASI